MKLYRLLIVSMVSCFFLSSTIFSVSFERGGTYFSGRSASFFIMDDISTINVRTQPQRGWQCTSFVKDCGDDIVVEEKTTAEVNCAGCCCDAQDICADIDNLCELVVYNSNAIYGHEIRIDHIETLTQTIVDNSQWIVDFVPCCEALPPTGPDDICPELGNICDFIVSLSIAIVAHNSQIINNSIAIVNTWDLTVENSIAINNLQDCCDNIATEICPELGDICEFVINNSNAIVNTWELTVENSIAINNLQDCCDNIATEICPELGDICEFVVNNSDAIVALRDCCETASGGAAGCNLNFVNTLITTDIELDRSCHLHPEDTVTVEGEVTIEGNGAMVVFSNPDNPQFILNPDTILTLKNITLKQINSNSFDLPACSRIKIGENVLFELSEDVIFANGVIEIIDVDGAPNVFTIRGMGGIKRLGFATVGCCITEPAFPRDTYRELDPLETLDLNYHTMLLQDIELLGVDHIKNSQAIINGSTVIGSIGLSGGVIVDIDVSNNLGFIVEGIDNEMRFIADNLTMGGRLLFGNWSDNVLFINAAIPQYLAQPAVINFEDNFMFVDSENGRAGLIFTDNMITVRNLASCSFIVADRSFLDGNKVTIQHNSIKQTSNDFELGLNIELLTDLPNAIEFTEILCVRSPMILEQISKVTTALHLKRAKERAELDRAIRQRANEIKEEQLKKEQGDSSVRPSPKARPSALAQKTSQSRPVPPTGARARKNQLPPRRSIGDYVGDEMEYEEIEYDEFILKNVLLSKNVHTVYNNVAKLGNASGNLITRYATLTDFGINPDRELNLTMERNVTIEQGDEPVDLKVGDILNVIGKNNKIVVRDIFTINGQLRFAPGAQLVIEFDETAKNPQVLFADQTHLELESNVHLEFTGRGAVVFGDGTVVEFKGTVPPGGICKSNCPELIVNNMVNAICDGQMIVRGVGRFEGRNGARVYAAREGHLIFGDEVRDILTIVFDRLATLRASGKISLHKARISVLFDRSASLIIEDNAQFEINCLNGVVSPGTIVDFTFDNDAMFKVEELGRLYFGDNADMRPMPWNHKKGIIRSVGAGGTVVFAPQTKSEKVFAGRMPDLVTLENNALLMGDPVSALQIVGALVHRDPMRIKNNIVFVDEKNNRMLRTKDGRIVSLRAKDGVEEDSFGRARVNGFHV